MRSGVNYLEWDSLGLWQGKMGYIRKNAIILCWFYMQKIVFYLKLIQIIIIKKIKSSKYLKNKKTKMPLLPSSFYTVFHLKVIIPKQNEFISLQCLGPFYTCSYDALTFMGLLGYRSYIVVPPHLIIVAPILQDISCSWLHMEIFGYFQEIMSKKCENCVSGKNGPG